MKVEISIIADPSFPRFPCIFFIYKSGHELKTQDKVQKTIKLLQKQTYTKLQKKISGR